MNGELLPGAHLSEDKFSRCLRVSRNTLREAFRLLSHEGLLVHRPHRGVLVRTVDEADVRDLFRLRQLLEVQVLRALSEADTRHLSALGTIVGQAERAARGNRWTDVGTANMRFHQQLVGLADSPRLDRIAYQLLAELRLAFHVAGEQEMYLAFVGRNRELLDRLRAGRLPEAADALEQYLADSQAFLLAAYRKR